MHYQRLQEGIRFNSQDYRLADPATLARLGIPRPHWMSNWSRRASSIITRPDVRQGIHPQEWVILADNWSKGICDSEANKLGCIYLAEGVNGLTPGALRPDPPVYVGSNTVAEENPPSWIGLFNNIVFICAGRRVGTFTTTTGVASALTISADKDFGAAVLVTDAIVWDDTGAGTASELYFAFGGSTTPIQRRNADGTYTASGSNYADHFAIVNDRLWRATATNKVSNIASGADPQGASTWSSGLTIGAATYGITDLNSLGEQLVVSKVEGLFLGDANAKFPNILPQFLVAPSADNGKQTLVRGSDVFYPHRQGIERYSNGGTEPVGPQETIGLMELADHIPGMRARSMCAYGNHIYAAFEDGGFPRANPTIIWTTADDVSYTDRTSTLTDNDVTTSIQLTGANNAYRVYVGYSAAFYGMLFELAQGAGNTVAAIFEYWNGSAWAALPAAAALQDQTARQSLSAPQPVTTAGNLQRSGFIWWENTGLGAWASTTVNGTAAFYIRFYTSSGSFPSTYAGEVRVMTQNPRTYVMRGRERNRQGDPDGPSILWEPFTMITGLPVPTAIAILLTDTFPYARGPAMIVAGQNTVAVTSGSLNAVDLTPWVGSGSQKCALSKMDGGSPMLQKQFTAVTVKGRGIDSNRALGVNYRLDYATAWTTLQASQTTTPAYLSLSNVTGYAIELQIVFNTFTINPVPEVNAIEIVCREIAAIGANNSLTAQTHNVIIRLTKADSVPPDTALSNLSGQVLAASATYVDVFGTQRTVTLIELDIIDVELDDGGYPDITLRATFEEII